MHAKLLILVAVAGKDVILPPESKNAIAFSDSLAREKRCSLV